MAKILVVEDNPANLKLAVLLLDHAGHEVLQARDAENGMALARDEQPDLILLDIGLPGLDGLRATQMLRMQSATHAIKIIAVTGHVMDGDESKFIAAGCDAYIGKPISFDTFLATIQKVLADG